MVFFCEMSLIQLHPFLNKSEEQTLGQKQSFLFSIVPNVYKHIAPVLY